MSHDERTLAARVRELYAAVTAPPKFRVVLHLSNYHLERRFMGRWWRCGGGPYPSLQHAVAAIDTKPREVWREK